ncbi:MAG TPA: T9SS type A sorting domain-containing protein [Ignavibacteriaceae bacterium]|nr:T9SS type A sorting domain-containing protein [Ignavibacteriaceae bacterium]
MRSFSYLFLFLFILGGLTLAQDAADIYTGPMNGTSTFSPQPIPSTPEAAELFDNGPVINAPGGGPGGSDGSVLQTSLLMNTLGGGWQLPSGISIADDFEVPAGGDWEIDSIRFYGYQTGSTTTTTFTGVYVKIYDGDPSAGGTVVWGDFTTNILGNTYWLNGYRYSETTVGTTRPIMAVVAATIGLTLAPGTYWIEATATGTLASGPWMPPVTITGQTSTGNAKQLTSTGWADWNDTGTMTPQGMPFKMFGTAGSPGYSFFDDFDSYVAGQLLALQNPTDWTTWSNNPGSAEDAMVTDLFSASNPNSVVFVTNDDVVKLHGDLTAGKWYTGFLMYIPTGKSGYWNMLSDFTFNTGGYWAFECYFDVGGNGRFLTGDPVTNFTWTPNTWQWVEVIVDLDTDQAEFWMGGSLAGGTLVKQWQWTNGTSTGFGPLVIDATDIFGATANDEMYMDNFFIGPASITPVELTSFGANVNAAGHVVLNWTTASEINNQMFEIERSIEGGEFFRIGYVEGHGTTTQQQEYSYTDVNVTPGTYFYRLKQIDYIGTFEYSNAVMVDVKGPLGFELGQNYPNPFNPSTIIDFNIPEAGMVKLAVYNILGEEVALLKNEYMQPGFYQTAFNAVDLPSGMYVYKLETANMVQARKMMLMK